MSPPIGRGGSSPCGLRAPPCSLGRDPDDYFVWVITGTEDFADPYDEDRVELMPSSRYFTEATNEQDGNFAFHVKDGYSHDGTAAMEYTYNGLRWFWNA